jgi:hypothetical protein
VGAKFWHIVRSPRVFLGPYQGLTAGYVTLRYQAEMYLQCSLEFRFNNKYRLPAFNGTCVWSHLESDRLEENCGGF